MRTKAGVGKAAKPQLHMIDLIRKKRDGYALEKPEIEFIVAGAAAESIPVEQLSAWLMATWLNGLSIDETRALRPSTCPSARARRGSPRPSRPARERSDVACGSRSPDP